MRTPYVLFLSISLFFVNTTVAFSQSAEVHPEIWPSARSPFGLDDEVEARISDLLSRMTLPQKVGQVIQADIASIEPADLKQYPLGSVLNGGNSAPGGNNRAPAKEWLTLADAFYHASRQCDLEGGPFIPLLWGTDAVHGHNNIVGATFFPHNIGLGAARNPQLLRRIGEITAKEIRVTGQEWTFAPTIAVVRDDRWGRTYEGYSEDPEITASYTSQLIEGIQGVPGSPLFLRGPHVIATAKHYVGDGGTSNGKDQGNNEMSEEDLRDLQAAGYPVAIRHGVQCVMASFSSWRGEKIHGHRGLLTDVLKQRMGFDGFLVGDWNAHGQVPGCSTTDALPVLNAGLDMFMAPDSWKGLFENLLEQAEAGQVDMSRLEDAVRRILRVKLRAKLFDDGAPSSRPFAGKFEELGKPEHRAIARQAVRESLVLLKNNDAVLPLSPKSTILVAGDGADNIGKQCGGWSLSWQGTGNSNRDFPGGTSIFEGIRQQVDTAGGRAILAVDGQCSITPDAAIVVFGEDPYAEFQGDVETLAYRPGDDTDYRMLKSFHDKGIPTVAVFLSGRPLWVNREINASQAFVAAWLPGAEGIGIADVLLRGPDNDIQYDFRGKLSYSWPRGPNQTPLNAGDEDYDPLFAYGYGLTYRDSVTVAMLPEVAEDPGQGATATQFFAKGRATPPWEMRLSSSGKSVEVRSTRGATDDGAITVVSADETAQEDIRTVTWAGKSEASFALASSRGVDLSSPTVAAMAIRLRVRVDQRPTRDVTFSLETATESQLPSLRNPFAEAPLGQWHVVSIPLANLATRDALKSVTASMVITTSGQMKLSVSSVGLEPIDNPADP
jgi:beta-glucosidase